jgi:hypothetical protein
MKHKLNCAIEASVSRRSPNEVYEVTEIPRIAPAKRRNCQQNRSEQIINEDTTASSFCLDWWVAFAEEFRHS